MENSMENIHFHIRAERVNKGVFCAETIHHFLWRQIGQDGNDLQLFFVQQFITFLLSLFYKGLLSNSLQFTVRLH